jgi:multicomponent K+:H+ antiporter subunit A
MPASFAIACVVLPAMAGLPPFSGFISKESALLAVFADAWQALPVALAVLVISALPVGAVLGVAYALRLWWRPFLGGQPPAGATPRDPSGWELLPMGISAAWTLLAGLAPDRYFTPWLALLAEGTAVPPGTPVELALWHGPGVALFVSLAAIAGGALLFVFWQPAPAGPARTEALLARALLELQGRVRLLAAGLWAPRLKPSITVLAWVTLVTLLPACAAMTGGVLPPLGPPPPLAGLLWGLAVSAALATVLIRHNRLLAVLLLAVVGVVLSVSFAHFSAPDLALTQILVELVSTLLLMLSLHFLPPTASPAPDRSLLLRVTASAGLGLMVALIVAQILVLPADGLAPWFLAHSLTDAGGANVVNVILVDFRGLDTLGEITVLGAAALVIAALLAKARVRVGPRARAPAGAEFPLLLAVVARLLMPVALLISAHLFLRGHNLPGGGFIAGLVIAVGIALVQMGRGSAWLARRLPFDGTSLVAAGLGIAVLTGLAALPLLRPFLTSAHTSITLPVLGELPLSSATLFDFGVYLVVIGSVTLILERIGGAVEAQALRAESS